MYKRIDLISRLEKPLNVNLSQLKTYPSLDGQVDGPLLIYKSSHKNTNIQWPAYHIETAVSLI